MELKILRVIKKLKNKIVRRLWLIFVQLKHRAWFLSGLWPCWCKKSHEAKVINEFRPKIDKILTDLHEQRLLPDWATDDKKLQKLCKKILSGQLWLFLDQFEALDSDGSFGWHKTCSHKNCSGCDLDFNKNKFCWDLWHGWAKNVGKKNKVFPDIRIAWEKSRLQFLIPLALADSKGLEPRAKNKIKEIVRDWIKNNKFLTGPNWTSAMEAAIRAVSLIWTACLVRDSKLSGEIVGLLCQHGRFIQNCWEDFDRPNNHVIADGVGLAYLSALFGKNNVFSWSLSQMNTEFKHQVFPDGSSYEGSTGYHRLVLELFVHHRALAKALGFSEPDWSEYLQGKMLDFFEWTHDQEGRMAAIGDQDSSKFVFGLDSRPPNANNALEQRLFANFGLAIFKGENIFCSVLTPTIKSQVPTGHLHQDWLSLTLNIDGVDIFVDPGSGFYTRSVDQRNFFRSFKNHSTVFVKNQPNFVEKENIFNFGANPQQVRLKMDQGQILSVYEDASSKPEGRIRVCRRIKIDDFFDGQNKKAWSVSICDKVALQHCDDVVWSFVLGPKVSAKQVSKRHWILSCGKKHFLLYADQEFTLEKGFFAKQYSKIVETNILQAIVKKPFNKGRFVSGRTLVKSFSKKTAHAEHGRDLF